MNENNEKLVSEAKVMLEYFRDLLECLIEKGDTESVEMLRKVVVSSKTLITHLVRALDVLTGEQVDIILDIDRKLHSVFLIVLSSDEQYPVSMFNGATCVKLWKREGVYMVLKHGIPVGIVGGVTKVTETWY